MGNARTDHIQREIDKLSKLIEDEQYPIQLRIFWVMKMEIEKTSEKTKDKELLREWLENIWLVSRIIGANLYALSPKHNLDSYLKDKIEELEMIGQGSDKS